MPIEGKDKHKVCSLIRQGNGESTVSSLQMIAAPGKTTRRCSPSTNSDQQDAHSRHYVRLKLAIYPPICAVMGGDAYVTKYCLRLPCHDDEAVQLG
jgi:hypothetical protein